MSGARRHRPLQRRRDGTAVGRPILTIGETDRFLDDGGIISLTLAERRVRFDVSASEARRAGLRISPQLLNLARSIRGGPS
jgi:hypothetical protein